MECPLAVTRFIKRICRYCHSFGCYFHGYVDICPNTQTNFQTKLLLEYKQYFKIMFLHAQLICKETRLLEPASNLSSATDRTLHQSFLNTYIIN